MENTSKVNPLKSLGANFSIF